MTSFGATKIELYGKKYESRLTELCFIDVAEPTFFSLIESGKYVVPLATSNRFADPLAQFASLIGIGGLQWNETLDIVVGPGAPRLDKLIGFRPRPEWRGVALYFLPDGDLCDFSIVYAVEPLCFPLDGQPVTTQPAVLSSPCRQVGEMDLEDAEKTLAKLLRPIGYFRAKHEDLELICQATPGSGAVGRESRIDGVDVVCHDYTLLSTALKEVHSPIALYPPDRIPQLGSERLLWVDGAVFRWPFILERVVAFCMAVRFCLPAYVVHWIAEFYPHAMLTGNYQRIRSIERLFESFKRIESRRVGIL